MSDAPDSAPVPPDSPALRAAQQALDAALADPGLDAGSADPQADLAEHARRLAQAQQALAALLDDEPPSPPPADDAEA